MSVRVPSALLTLLYVLALVVALADLGARALAGAVVLAGLLLREACRAHRSRVKVAVVAGAPVVPG